MAIWNSYTPTNRVILGGNQEVGEELSVEVATGMIPGVLVAKGTTDDDMIVCTASLRPIGVLGYEKTAILQRPVDSDGNESPSGTYVVLKRGFVHQSNDLVWWAWVASGQTIVKGDRLVPTASGELAKVTTLTVASGAVTVTSSGANGAIVSGNDTLPAPYAIALESKASSTSAVRLKVERV